MYTYNYVLRSQLYTLRKTDPSKPVRVILRSLRKVSLSKYILQLNIVTLEGPLSQRKIDVSVEVQILDLKKLIIIGLSCTNFEAIIKGKHQNLPQPPANSCYLLLLKLQPLPDISNNTIYLNYKF